MTNDKERDDFENDPRVIAMRASDDQAMAHAATLTVPACPEWCEDRNTADHQEYTDRLSDDEQTFVRDHTLGFGDQIYITQEERNRDNVVTLSPPRIQGFADLTEDGLEAQKACQIAAALLNAADKLNEITGQ